MSRSRKKHSIQWLCTNNHGEMKKWKRDMNRSLRRMPIEKHIDDGAAYKRFSDIWDSPSDGKIDWGDEKHKRK